MSADSKFPLFVRRFNIEVIPSKSKPTPNSRYLGRKHAEQMLKYGFSNLPNADQANTAPCSLLLRSRFSN